MNSGIGTMVITSSVSTISLSANEESPATTVYEINPLCDPRWEALVNSHPRASVFHSTSWLRALETAYGYDPLVLTTCSPDAALTNGLVLCRVDSWLTGRRFVSLPFSDHCEPLVSNSGDVDDLLMHMRRHVDADNWKYIEIRPLFLQPGSQTGLTISDAYSVHSLDLRKSARELFHNFHKDCVQRKIRRAEREKLHYEEGASEALLQQFYQLLAITRRRQGLPPQPLSWFRQLLAAFGGNLKIRVAIKDTLPIASILTLDHRKTMVYKYGCSDARFHKDGGMALLFWNAIQEAKERGFEHFEMGRSDKDNLGLISFKEHWGAVGTDVSYWKYARRPGITTDSWKKSALRHLVPVTPDSILRAVGRLLYRHVG
jgi:CelD/BcsL family acetyltransferase involved in cellulose biosynthesis